MHTMWKGSVQFGLVSIPIKMFAATEDKDVSFRTLHEKCSTPIKYEKVCPVCEEKVENDDLVKGYETTNGDFVIVSEEEMKSLQQEADEKAVEIMDFIDIDEIDPIYFNRTYYLGPNEGGSKAYALLRKALSDTRKVGVAKMMIRSKEQLALLRVYNNTLLVETLHYPDEIRAAEDVPGVPSDENISDKELKTAETLIDQLSTEFEPQKYEDEYRKKLLELIEAKEKGKEVVTAKGEPKKDNVTDLMEALQKSVDKNKKKTSGKKKTTGAKSTASKTTKKKKTG
ncbi:Ku protein [Texcoconibacillus texcoconensis]|uniref:Non-homologous end joining protein Ku n=1 Tax=Texcoconibacillus texcoconensis TaxID=1095777 RepID=A0A840QMB7_9BACI|nr:Ku protein [Texcoconibacillus texcoconensis]MBB5172493.1 DNA end-binding protein Ku [Texcoconibacillus texcoconensis]